MLLRMMLKLLVPLRSTTIRPGLRSPALPPRARSAEATRGRCLDHQWSAPFTRAVVHRTRAGDVR